MNRQQCRTDIAHDGHYWWWHDQWIWCLGRQRHGVPNDLVTVLVVCVPLGMVGLALALLVALTTWH